jgi:hypothetical protein
MFHRDMKCSQNGGEEEEGNRPLEKHRHIQKDNIKMHPIEM